MVADPLPLTIANLRSISQWADLLLTEGTTTTSGQPRTPLREGWRDLLGLQPPELRVLTTDLAGPNTWLRQRVQRNSAAAVLGMLPEHRPVLMVDADELLDPDSVLAVIAEGIEEPVRLGLVPLYGAVDRVAPAIHCCWREDAPDLRSQPPQRPYVIAAPSLATAGMMQGKSPSVIRFQSRLISRDRTFGVHATMVEPVPQVQWKMANMRHVWDPRVLAEQHLNTVLKAGVHHAGWWIADYRQPEPWLADLAEHMGLRVAGPRMPSEQLRAIRAWSQIRLDPSVPEVLVSAGDAYVATRPHDAQDFFNELDDYLVSRPLQYTGHSKDDPGSGAHDAAHVSDQSGTCDSDTHDCR